MRDRVRDGAHDPDDAFAQKGMQYIEFMDNQGTVEDPAPGDKPEPNDFDNPLNIPGRLEPLAAPHIAWLHWPSRLPVPSPRNAPGFTRRLLKHTPASPA